MLANKIKYLIAKCLQPVWQSGLLLCILPFVLLCYYTHPSIHDDYLDANSILKAGRIAYIKNNYNNWTGRYTELLLKSALSPLTYNDSIVREKIFTLTTLVALFGALLFLCKAIFYKYKYFQISVLLFVMLLSGFTNISSFLYWSGGYTAYTYGVIFSILFLALLYRLRSKFTYVILALCCLLVFSAVGSYEVVMMMIIWITLSNLIYAKLINSGFADACVLFAVSLSSAAVSVLAPGNIARAAASHSSDPAISVSSLLLSIFKSLFFAAGAMTGWLDNLLLMIGTLLFLQLIHKKEINIMSPLTVSPVLLALWLFVGISISILPSIIVYQAVWEHTWQSIYVFFLLGWLVVASAFASYLEKYYGINKLIMHVHFVAVCRGLFLFIIFISSSSNINIAYLDLLKAPEYQRRLLRRDANIKQAASRNKKALLQPLFLPEERYMLPQTLYTIEYGESDAQAFANYHGVDSIDINRCYLLK
ncbi:hypothetical protein [Hymenobacter lucidus]|uniref:Glycosyltransferase RgtA/B/C/D-like domain-containing protein n=1 Tax=Hymenobacter lucidus TaxID=2880930 RepID=A0ABS8ARY6_9BACT|nr:hypothetical protein [Hymenobacter lucidus]MCB2408514.1 hypothetical protein [Hymenobacter lucidus]